MPLNIIVVGYDKMLYSIIKGIKTTEHKIVGALRNDRIKYSNTELFLKDIFNPSKDYQTLKMFNIYDIKANSVNSEKFLKEIKRLKADMIIVGSWAEKFKPEILSTLPCINFHPALLPKNRGANPYFWTIYLNQKVSGLTIHFMNEKFDKGDIILQEAIPISEKETGQSLKDKTTKLACAMVVDFLELWGKNQIQPIKQNEKFASYEPQLSLKELTIDLNNSKKTMERHLRALYPWSNPYIKIEKSYYEIKKWKITNIEEKYSLLKPYEIISKKENSFVLKGVDFIFEFFY